MATVRYILKSKKNPSSLYIRFRAGTKVDFIYPTGFSVNPTHWSKSRQAMKDIVEQDKIINKSNQDLRYAKLNKHLIKLREYTIDSYNEAQMDGNLIDKNWFNQVIIDCFNRPQNDGEDYNVFFVPFIQKYIEEAPRRLQKQTNKPVTNSTIKVYRATLNKILDFEEFINQKTKYKDLNLIFHKQFVDFLKTKQELDLKTIGNYIKNIKMLARKAKLEGLPVHVDIEHPEFFRPNSKTYATYLNEKEIEKIFKHDFSDNERLNNARDLFIIGLWTGQRISDFKRIKETNLKDGFIEITTQKTGKEVIIPLHPQIKHILDKREGIFPRTISDQNFNEYIKEIGKEVGFNESIEGTKINPETRRKEKGIFPKYELFVSHICRRSFASNHYGKLPTETIMAVTGHTSQKVFLDYIKITSKEHAEKMQDLWLRQAEENNYEHVKMKVVK